MENEPLTPLFALAVSMAYEIRVDEKTTPQEKGQLIALFGKLVEMETINDGELQSLISKAFNYTNNNSVDDFLLNATPGLSGTQRLAIIINLYDTMQTDGHIKKGEQDIIQKFEKAFNIDKNIASGIRKFLMLKNDTSIFLDQSHPLNNTAFNFEELFVKK
ncbi:MAG: TerB family tellurite resistance protein [Rhodospirillaceae bacterium]|jgi:uncharacterized tellurite resistance protein B-like protein|nr:TerB family tellurite resistance protein [Rhodospirillaceae bacterium]MBT5243263.1 TerB family tellurite resistance protein [Rhodospirillaceae bacterium]MBT5563953.1 TerB family tellurite resistance protein [Rhodospirillaceae bacterium]MBT6240843.1 TerB family tellurite resistance protein [Rhodospirillaceae bacterium]